MFRKKLCINIKLNYNIAVLGDLNVRVYQHQPEASYATQTFTDNRVWLANNKASPR